MAIRVECYAGYRGEQEPLAFWLGQHQCPIIPDLEFADDVNRPTPDGGVSLKQTLDGPRCGPRVRRLAAFCILPTDKPAINKAAWSGVRQRY
jgi:hypothetical protein